MPFNLYYPLHRNYISFQVSVWTWRVMIPRPSDYESAALTNWATGPWLTARSNIVQYPINLKRGTSYAVKLFSIIKHPKASHLATDPLQKIILSNIQGLAGKPGQEGLEPSPKALTIEVVLGTGFEPVIYRMKICCPWPTRRTEQLFQKTFNFVVFIYNKYRSEI